MLLGVAENRTRRQLIGPILSNALYKMGKERDIYRERERRRARDRQKERQT